MAADGAPVLRALSDAVLAFTSERSVSSMLQRIAHAVRELVGARYAAIGIPDGNGGFAQFITSGMTDSLIEAIGPLPRTHGLLAAMLEDAAPYRSRDVGEDPRFEYWPAHHPHMRSFLGVPIVSRSSIVGAFYLTDKIDADDFTLDDQRLVEMLAAHAAIALENARLLERVRELAVIEERNRLARDLHDSVSQTLFSAVFTAEAAATLLDTDGERARVEVKRLRDLTRDALQEMRSLIFELRPPGLDDEGLVPTLRKHVDVLRRVHHVPIELDVEGDRRLDADRERELFRIAQEALHNALKHAKAAQLRVSVEMNEGTIVLTVSDDGAGFDPAAVGVRARHLGLTSMEERAEALGGSVRIDSRRGAGTEVRVEVPAVG